MHLVSVNVGTPRAVNYRGKEVRTGIFKAPVEGAVMIRTLNVDGDGQADLRVHGGEDKAVYAYPIEHYDHWGRELVRDDLGFGQFGENLTVAGMTEDDVRIGDVYRVGAARLQVTQPRTPCYKLGLRMGDPGFPKRFLESRRTGFYCRVLQEGEVRAGDGIELLERDPTPLSVRETVELLHFDRENVEGAARAARVMALSPSWRKKFVRRSDGALSMES